MLQASSVYFIGLKTTKSQVHVGLVGRKWGESCSIRTSKFFRRLDFGFWILADATNTSLTFVWDVRTKRVTYESVPTVDGIVGIANYGPTATLFTLGRNHTVQQYDLNPNAKAPLLVQNVQHVPAKLPPSPPTSDEEPGVKLSAVTAGATDPRAIYFEAESSGEEGIMTMSPLQRIAQEMDQLEEEKRDQLGALSPVSSKSSLSSRSGGAVYAPSRVDPPRARSLSNSKLTQPHLSKEKPPSPGMASSGSSYGTGTTFSSGAYRGIVSRNPRESVSIRTMTSGSSHQKSSRLRQEVMVSPDTPTQPIVDLFPYTKARLGEVKFQAPVYDQDHRTPDDLRRQMLRVVFGWHDDVENMIRDELSRHPPGSPSTLLLSKWLGDLGDDLAAAMVGSESMTSTDWMLLALSAMGSDSQKKVGEAFVDRLLAKGDIHPAVTILLGLGEHDEAIEAYVSRRYYMEAVLLTCLIFPLDWGRQSHLVRKWGEQAVSEEPKHPELAVRCFSCTSVESSEPWFSPRAQDAIYAAQQTILGPSPPTQFSPASPPQSAKEGRLVPSQAGLKLVTNFTPPQNLDPLTVIDDKTPMTYHPGGVTPIDSAVLSPSVVPYPRLRSDPNSARTATPGGYDGRRVHSRDAAGRHKRIDGLTPVEESVRTAVPMTAFKSDKQDISFHRTRSASTGQSSKMISPGSTGLLSTTSYLTSETVTTRGRNLPSPAHGIFTRLNEESRARNGSRDRKPDGLQLHMEEVVVLDSSLPSGNTSNAYTLLSDSVTGLGASVPTTSTRTSRKTAQSADAELKSSKIRSIDEYINSLDVAQTYAKHQPRSSSKQRAESQDSKSLAAPGQRAPSEGRGRAGVRYVKAAKRSPSSPVSMSPDDPALMLNREGVNEFQDERYYKLVAPVEAQTSRTRNRSEDPIPVGGSARTTSRSRRSDSTERQGVRTRSASRPAAKVAAAKATSRQQSTERETQGEARGRSKVRREGSTPRSPSAPTLRSSPEKADDEGEQATGDRSSSRRRRERGTSSSRTRSPDRRLRERSRSQKRPLSDVPEDLHPPRTSSRPRTASKPGIPKLVTNLSESFILTKKELAAQELEARRLSLARRPSAPSIPHPDELSYPKSAIEPSMSPNWDIPNERQLMRNTAIDPDNQLKVVGLTSGVSTSSAPIGLPATPRAMRHPKYMYSPSDQSPPELPEIPQELAHLATAPQPPPLSFSVEPPMLLPATTFQPPPPRSASAPVDKGIIPVVTAAPPPPPPTIRRDSSGLHSRKTSADIRAIHPPGTGSVVQSPIVGGIDETLAGRDVVVVEANPAMAPQPAVLPELQHLAGPPVPPPPPTMFRPGHASSYSVGTIDPADLRHPTPAAMNPIRQATPIVDQQPPSNNSSPNVLHRRGRGSMSESVGQKLRNVTQRIRERSTSRNRTKSPPQQYQGPAPYESIPIRPGELERRGSAPAIQKPTSPSSGRVLMPYETGYYPPTVTATEQAMMETAAASTEALPSTTYGGYRNPKDIAKAMTQDQVQFGESGIGSKSGTPFSGYKDPKEIRANMPPEQLQLGVGPSVESGRM